MTKVTVFLPPSITEAFEIVLARACDIDDAGELVTLAYCTGKILGCVANPFGWSKLCKHCVRVTEHAINQVLPTASRIHFFDVAPKQEVRTAAEKSSKNGPRSTILTFYRQDIKNINWRHKNALFMNLLFKSFMKYEIQTYIFTNQHLIEAKPQRIEYFNGRITPTMSIAQAAIDNKVPHCAIEVSGFNKKFFLANNAKVHDLCFLKQKIKMYEPSGTALLLGEMFFKNKRNGVVTNDKVYTNNQRTGLFEKQNSKNIVAIFLSSTDEIEVYGDQWLTHSSKDPASCVLCLRRALDTSYEIVVRMHPNQAGDKTGMSQEIEKALEGKKGIVLIKPTSEHSSYELLDLASFVITFGSTLGFEATYWNKPSILMGRSTWEDENIAYIADSAKEAAELITSNKKPLNKDKAIKVAAYYMDELDKTKNLSYSHAQKIFLVKGINFLPEKRRSLVYKFNRAIDKLLIR